MIVLVFGSQWKALWYLIALRFHEVIQQRIKAISEDTGESKWRKEGFVET